VSDRASAAGQLHVLHVINNLAVGGAERFVVLLAAAQRRLGWRVGVATLTPPSTLGEALVAARVELHPLGRARLNDPRLLPDLVRLLRRVRPDVVHTHLFYADSSGRLAARIAGIPTVVSTEHSTEGAPLSLRRRTTMRWTAGAAHRIVAVSEAVRDATAVRLGIDAARIAIIPNGIDLDPWARAEPLPRASLGVPDDAFVVGSIGRLDEPKGYEFLIEAVAAAGDSRWHLVFAGDGPQRAALEAAARTCGIEATTHWLGWRDDVARILASLDVFVLPSRWEGHSMALLEAMAAGRACVVSDIPELATVIGSAGERVARGDAPALTSALRRLHADPERRAQLGRDAQAAVQPYSIAASAERYAALYREVASQQAAARR